ncbi:MAG: hypothetical protein FJ291_17965 [Planctomycetes bacterium]|nr:hypothetical protein [Planctomycetota bacterium]
MRDMHYNALEAQYWFLRSRAQFAGLFGGIGSGKSHAGCFWALLKALKNPRCLGLIGANSYHQLQDATLRTFQRFLAEYHIPHRFNVSDMRFRLANGAEILCRSMENYDSLRGIELGWFYLDELRDTRLEAWRVVQGRLRGQNVDAREGRVTTSPNGFNWIYDEFIRRPSNPADAEGCRYKAFFGRTRDNKHLPGDYVQALLGSYDPLLAAQELDGRFLNTTAGRIYHAFDRFIHVSDAADFVPGEPVYWALDFNVSPMTAVIAQWDPFGVPPSGGSSEDRVNAGLRTGLRVVDELWLTDSGTMAMCEAFGQWLERASSREPRAASHFPLKLEARGSKLAAVFVYGDAAGGNRSTSGKSDYAIIRQCFPQARICVPAANPPRRDRYNAVNAALCDALGRVKLRIHPRCTRLLTDLEEMVYQPHTGMPDTSNPERGHISDALGYLVARLMPAGRAGVCVGQW